MSSDGADPRRVLVVDDEEILRDLLAEMLEACCGCRTDVAGDGREAMQRVRDQTYDLILTDYLLPGLDGPSFYRTLRSQSPAQADRVAFMTGLDIDSSPIKEFLEASHRPALRKPFNLRELDAFVREVLPSGS